MADATITIKLTPSEFDLLRRAITSSADSYGRIVREDEVDSPTKRTLREEEARLRELLRKLN